MVLVTKKTERRESSYTKIAKYAMENVRIVRFFDIHNNVPTISFRPSIGLKRLTAKPGKRDQMEHGAYSTCNVNDLTTGDVF